MLRGGLIRLGFGAVDDGGLADPRFAGQVQDLRPSVHRSESCGMVAPRRLHRRRDELCAAVGAIELAVAGTAARCPNGYRWM